jgi:dihydropteroate synthase
MKPLFWNVRGTHFDLARQPLVQGVINVTPDSFFEGSRFDQTATAIAQAERLLAEGADLLDIGGESTRPGATPVPLDEELRRVIPVITAIAKLTDKPISIDTMKPEVARQAVAAGASIMNDVSGFRNPDMVRVAKVTGAGLIVMHMPGTPETMNISPSYSDIITEVVGYLRGQIEMLLQVGIERETIAIDPGIGFGKFTEHSLTILANLEAFAPVERPVVLGVSRKGFLGKITGRDTHERMPAGLAVASFALAANTAHILRVHDVAPTVDAVKMHLALEKYRQPFHRDSL